MDQTALLHYQEQLTLWEEQEEERKHLFTITERDLVRQRKVNTPSQSDLKRYQVITNNNEMLYRNMLPSLTIIVCDKLYCNHVV